MEFKKNYEELFEETQKNFDDKLADLMAELEETRNRLGATLQENNNLNKINSNLNDEIEKLKKMLKAMGKQKKMNVDDVVAKMNLNSNLNLNSLNTKNEEYDKIIMDNYLFHIIKVSIYNLYRTKQIVLKK